MWEREKEREHKCAWYRERNRYGERELIDRKREREVGFDQHGPTG